MYKMNVKQFAGKYEVVSLSNGSAFESLILNSINIPLWSDSLTVDDTLVNAIMKLITIAYEYANTTNYDNYVAISIDIKRHHNYLYATIWHFDKNGSTFRATNNYKNHCDIVDSISDKISELDSTCNKFIHNLEVEQYVSNWYLHDLNPVDRMTQKDEGHIMFQRVRGGLISLAIKGKNETWLITD